jgi:hypothetical protein
VTFTLDLVAGPDAGRRVVLEAGRHLVGRSTGCSVVIDDASIEAHHLMIDVSGPANVELVQLAGRVPLLVDGEAAGAGRRLRVAHSIEVGDTRLELPESDVHGRRLPGVVELGVTVDALAAPVTLTAFEGSVVGIVDLDPAAGVARSVARSIASQVLRAGPILAMPELVLALPGDPRLDACSALLEVGPRWRGRWTPDATERSVTVRLHVAGARRSVGFGIDRAFVAEQVSRPVAELGGDVVRVPQPA